jgi:sterol desaturase/sphingolipid hydroxylase (fatty acid hydroxylase superfamily)
MNGSNWAQPAMAFEPASVTDGSRPAVDMASRRTSGRHGSLWATAALGATLVFACIAVGVVAFGTDLKDADGNAFPFDWAGGLDQFIGQLYERQVFQVVIAALLVGYVLERFFPACPQRIRNRGLNIPYGLLIILFISATGPLQVLIANGIIHWTGWRPPIDLRFDVGHRLGLAFAAMLVGALIVDFFFYWFHRLQHSSQVLWQVHLLHHSDMALNVTTTNRTHFFEHVLTPLFMATPITLLFSLPRSDVVMISVLPLVWSHFVHTNIRLGFGKLWWLISSPQYHRIHHSIQPEHQNRNFAVWFPLWDILFGTAFAPRPGEYPQSGVDGIEVSTFSDAVTLPCVQWYRMARSGAGLNDFKRPAHELLSRIDQDGPHHGI